MRASTAGIVACLTLALAACTNSDHRAAVPDSGAAAPAPDSNAAVTPPAPTMSTGVAITTTDGGFTLALVHDSVLMGFSDKVLNSVATESQKAEAKTDSEGGGAFGAALSKAIVGGVQKAMGAAKVRYALSDIEDVRYEDGAIKFQYRNGAKHTPSFEGVRSDKGPVLERFAPADAERFVAAVHSAKWRS